MRTLCVLTLLASEQVLIQATADDTKPLTPAEAIKKVNEEVTVQMLVKASKNRLEKRGEIYLDSEENFQDEKNLGIVVTKTGAVKFKAKGVDDPAVHFKDKTIRVKGTVIIKEKRPRIEVDDPKQIVIVETGDAKKEQERLQGSWTVVSHMNNNRKSSDEQVKKMKAVIEGRTLTLSGDKEKMEIGFKLHPSKRPKAMELELQDPKKHTIQGIYELEGDLLKIAWNNQGEGPKAFPKEPKEGTGMIVLKRATDK
jgi:uncharacterized protein (TIGR03067 family)